MVQLKRNLFLIGFIIPITIQQRPNQEFLQAVIKEFQMESPLLVTNNISHDFTLMKNIMAKTQFVKIMTNIPDKIVPSSSILLNIIDTKAEAVGVPKGEGEAIVKFSIVLSIARITLESVLEEFSSDNLAFIAATTFIWADSASHFSLPKI